MAHSSALSGPRVEETQVEEPDQRPSWSQSKSALR